MASKRYLIRALVLFFSLHGQDNNSPDVAQASKKSYDKVATSPDLKKTLNQVIDKAKKVYDGGVNMLEGMGQSFGWVTKDYTYSYRVFNDAPSPVFVATEQLTELLGATARGQIKNATVLGPNANTFDALYNQQLFLTVWICGNTQKDVIHRYSETPHAFFQKYGGIAGKLYIQGQNAGNVPAGFAAAANVVTEIAATVGTDLGALISGVFDIVRGLEKEGLTILKKVTGLSIDPSSAFDPLERYALVSRIMGPPGQKNDDKVYYYHTFARYNEDKKKLELQGEYLDLAGTTSEFSGQFYNRSVQNIPMTFSKDNTSYMVTLEPGSFNLLESSKNVDYSIRPKNLDDQAGFQFYTQSVSDQNKLAFIPISPDGIGNVVSTQKDSTKPVKKDDLVVVGPKLYTYEIVDTAAGPVVGVAGLKIGNYDQPVSGKVRDINPVVCHLWYKDAQVVQAEKEKEQKAQNATQDYSAVPFDVPEQLWINYKTADFVLQEKVPTGSSVNFDIIRPQLQEKEAWLYVVTLQTDDDAQAKKFLDRLSAGKIGEKSIYTDVTQEQLDKNTVLNMQANVNGFIDDTQGADASGVTGAVVVADYFAPQGVGSGPFYYEVDPGLLRIDQFASSIWYDTQFYTQDPKTGAMALKADVLKELSTLLPQWIVQYKTKPDAASAALKEYLLQKGNAGDPAQESNGIFVDATKPPAQRELTLQGKNLLQTLIDGPISLKNYPIMRKAGTNWYTRNLGDTPDGWPK